MQAVPVPGNTRRLSKGIQDRTQLGGVRSRAEDSTTAFFLRLRGPPCDKGSKLDLDSLEGKGKAERPLARRSVACHGHAGCRKDRDRGEPGSRRPRPGRWNATTGGELFPALTYTEISESPLVRFSIDEPSIFPL